MPKSHDLKTWPGYFQAAYDGAKSFEVRKNDRGFELGDQLRLREFDPITGQYSGRVIYRTVAYILHGPAVGIPQDYCVMAIR